jgi:hypothetical protein
VEGAMLNNYVKEIPKRDETKHGHTVLMILMYVNQY